jgi:hypothetical protein
VALTLPFVGVHSWSDWLTLGKQATEVDEWSKVWITLSRDLIGLVRRAMTDFDLPWNKRAAPEATLYGYALLGGVFLLTLGVAVLRPREVRAVTGPGAGWMLLSGWLCCFHFLYYDTLLAALPVLLVVAAPRGDMPGRSRYWLGRVAGWLWFHVPHLILLLMLAHENGLHRYKWEIDEFIRNTPDFWAEDLDLYWELSWLLPAWAALAGYVSNGVPWDTFFLIGLWLWCGVTLVARRPALLAQVEVVEEEPVREAPAAVADERVRPAPAL